MNTPSNLIMTAALRKGMQAHPIPRGAFLLGSILPDIPFWLLSIGGGLYFRYGLGWTGEATARHMFDTLYFYDPGWMFAYNILHAPLVLLTGLTPLWRFRWNLDSPLRLLFWFLSACLLHALVDILTHNNDGPLLLFPFEWTLRFRSPVSYWDPQFYGREFGMFELIFDIVLLAYLFVPPLIRRVRDRRQHPARQS